MAPAISSILPSVPLNDTSSVNLDISGVAGFFGGDVAVSAMGTIHMYRGQRFLGWYNTPGSYEIAKRYGQLARSRFWDGLYPGINLEPEVLFGLDGEYGPKYHAALSGAMLRKTGHVSHLLFQQCKLPEVDVTTLAKAAERYLHELKPPRQTSSTHVTIAILPAPSSSSGHLMDDRLIPEKPPVTMIPLAILGPIFTSVATCVICALSGDIICCTMIALGILVNGLSSLIIGSGELSFSYPIPVNRSPPGHGLLEDGGDDLMILVGEEGPVNAVTRGSLELKYGWGAKSYHPIGICAMALTLQFLAQLLLVPQGTQFGQVMFLTSLGTSWIYNSYLSSEDRECVQRRMLITHKVLPSQKHILRCTLGTRTTAVIFILLVLASEYQPRVTRDRCPSAADSAQSFALDEETLLAIMDGLIPNKTESWINYKKDIVHQIVRGYFEKDRPDDFEFRSNVVAPPPALNIKRLSDPSETEYTLYDDAHAAYAYFRAYNDCSEKIKGCGSGKLAKSSSPHK